MPNKIVRAPVVTHGKTILGDRMKIFFSMTLLLTLLLLSGKTIAETDEGGVPVRGWSPFQFSIYSPLQLIGKDKDIAGLRLTLLHGKNVDVSGIDLGLGVNSSDHLTGIQISGVANYSYSTEGIQIGGLGNEVDYLSGIQIAGISNLVRNDAVGIQIALAASMVNGTMKGVQISGLNNWLSPTSSSVIGMQIGLFNYAGNVKGVQIGIINACENLSGIQIGILNYIKQGRFPWFPIINAKF